MVVLGLNIVSQGKPWEKFQISLQQYRVAVYLLKYAIKIIQKAIKIKCMQTEKQFHRSVCNYMRCHCIPFALFHLGNTQMPVGYCKYAIEDIHVA